MSEVKRLRITATADLHWGIAKGMAANGKLCQAIRETPPDILLLAGDIGHGEYFEKCLEEFSSLTCVKALVPGNHDIWVTRDDSRGDSWAVYNQALPKAAARHGFHYLDQQPLHLPEQKISLVGSMNWYDYSWSEEELRRVFPGETERLATKKFTRGQHNDFHYIRWELGDREFTSRLVSRLKEQVLEALNLGHKVVLATHHPACRALSFPRLEETPHLDRLLWEGFSGNQALEEALTGWKESLLFLLSGHIHFFRQEKWQGIPCVNIGGDYHFKRAVRLEFPGPTVEFDEFHS